MRIHSLFTIVAVCVGLSGCASRPTGHSPTATTGDPAAAHYHAVGTPGAEHGWVVLLPGSSGLRVLGDDRHYFRAAERLNEAGFGVLLIDYKAAYRASPGRPRGAAGDKIAWVVRRAVEWGIANGHIRRDQPGAIVAWSLGAEGIWALARSDGFDEIGVVSIAAYYPSVERELEHAEAIAPLGVPGLVVTGMADNITEHTLTRDALRDTGIEIVAYPLAHHGFDVASLDEPVTMRVPPIIGPKATFAYDAEAAADAAQRIMGFLRPHLVPADDP